MLWSINHVWGSVQVVWWRHFDQWVLLRGSGFHHEVQSNHSLRGQIHPRAHRGMCVCNVLYSLQPSVDCLLTSEWYWGVFANVLQTFYRLSMAMTLKMALTSITIVFMYLSGSESASHEFCCVGMGSKIGTCPNSRLLILRWTIQRRQKINLNT